MNKKKFEKKLNNLIKTKSVTPFSIDQLFKSKKSIFNDEKVEVLLQNNFSKVIEGMPQGSVEISLNSLHEHPKMKDFIEKEDTIKMVLTNVDSFDLRTIILNSNVKEPAKNFINSNFDYVINNFDLKKIVGVFESVELSTENKEKMHEFYLKNKDEFLKDILTRTLSTSGDLNKKEADGLVKIVSKVVDKAMEHEKCKVTDIKTLPTGGSSSVIKLGDTIIKVGTPRETFDMPNDERILQPHLRRNLEKELGIKAVIEVADRVDTDFNISEEEMYSIYKDMRNRGIVCGDFKYGNIGKLLKDNPPRSNEKHGLHGNVNKTLKAGDYVLIDTDYVYKEGDNKTKLTSDMSTQFEKRYQSEQLEKSSTKNVQASREVKTISPTRGR